MVIGPTNCGKTTLVHALNDHEGPIKKTQNLIYGKYTIDVPGSYIENAWMYKYLISAVQDASHVLILVDQSKCANVYSPGFAKVFRCPVIGVITKVDVNPENEANCLRQLQQIGVQEPYFKISTANEKSISNLKDFLLEKVMRAENEIYYRR